MNNFDKQRIENAIWILEQYNYKIIEIAEKLEWDSYTCENMWSILREVKEQLTQ